MRIHFLQHVPYESPGTLLSLAKEHRNTLGFTHLYRMEELPSTEDFDLLISLGGPMNIYEEEKYPFLTQEKDFIRKAIAEGKMILGICLGAQLIADVLGAEVYPNSQQEIGWFSLSPDRNTDSDFLDLFPEEKLTAFHWHGYTFDLPNGSQRLFSSETTLNQGFMFGNKVLAFQFHWEVTQKSVKQLVENNNIKNKEGNFVQQSEEILAAQQNFSTVRNLMEKTLLYFKKQF